MLLGLTENKPVPGGAVTVLPIDQLNPLWMWQFALYGTVPVDKDEGGNEQTQ